MEVGDVPDMPLLLEGQALPSRLHLRQPHRFVPLVPTSFPPLYPLIPALVQVPWRMQLGGGVMVVTWPQ
jgi:hypothetical protein